MANPLSGVMGAANVSNGSFRINLWELNNGPDELDSTGFGSTLKQRMAGMEDFRGRLVGYLTDNTPPFVVAAGQVGATARTFTAIVSLMANAACGYTATVMLSNFRTLVNQLNTTSASNFSCNFANCATAYQSNWTAIAGN